MLQKLQQWNRRARPLVWALVILGILASLPIAAARSNMEQTSNTIEYVYDYQDLVKSALFESKPLDFVHEQLGLLKDAGITTMALFETSLDELRWHQRLSYYSSSQIASMQGLPAPINENYTYVLFANGAADEALRPLIARAFEAREVAMEPWSYEGREGFVLQASVENTAYQTLLEPDPLALEDLHALGFQLMPRLSDKVRPYVEAEVEAMLQNFQRLGVQRILFDGVAVKGYADHKDTRSLDSFAMLLNKYGIGLVTIENLRVPQKGLNTLSYLTNYNTVRLYSLSDTDAISMTPEGIIDRFQLAAKDRNIRIFYLNSSAYRNPDNPAVYANSVANIITALDKRSGGAIAELEAAGYDTGLAKPFDYQYESWMKALKAVVALGAVALIALLIGAFARWSLLPVLALGLLGSAGLYVLSPTLLEQGLALGAAISAPVLASVWVINRLRAHTEGDRRMIGGAAERLPASGGWLFADQGAGRRLAKTLSWYVLAAIVSFAGVPFIIGLLNNITYSLALELFRGVSLLYSLPIALVAIYLLFYSGMPLWGSKDASLGSRIKAFLMTPITVVWVVLAAIAGIVGMYYMSRTGNSGSVSSIELVLRNIMEGAFGVRPRFKELLGHPVMLLGIFLGLRYRAAWLLVIIGVIGQLSMVGTFAHIHTPIYISAARSLLGLGIGIISGLLLIVIWQAAEGAFRRWWPKAKQAFGL